MTRGLTHFSPSALRALRTNAALDPDRSAMTADALAQAVGTTKAQILAYENGHRVPDPPRVSSLAAALRVRTFELMDPLEQKRWALADLRRASGLRALDVATVLGVAPKNYRRFEVEGIVPSRSPQFVDDVASVLGVTRSELEDVMDRTPAVQCRRDRAVDLVVSMADRYVPVPGPWRGPSADDADLIELAALYGRPVQRIRRVLTHELGEVRQTYVRSQRERVVADFDTNRTRQLRAQDALAQWRVVTGREIAQIPHRLERFHRSAQPSDVWKLLIDLHNVDATYRPDAGNWAVTSLLCHDPGVLPRHMVHRRMIDDVAVCRLSMQGLSHLQTFTGLYAYLFPGVHRPRTARSRSRIASTGGQDTFALPGHSERLVIPGPALETARSATLRSKGLFSVELSPSYTLLVGTQSVTAVPALPAFDTTDAQAS
ncbi:helix-turn-helix domain-containing protein [Streptomyces sp. IBSBF 2806]|uniref:helix-turn-helix domain-containing protein n=1 Tax=Streptomyces sp. IBSBF 2806 TaxID=2903529 RepID=UPI002FDB9AD3